LQNLDQFHGLLGLAWIEVYVLFGPALGAITIMQLARPGVDRHSGSRLPPELRLAFAVQALIGIAVGAALFASSWPSRSGRGPLPTSRARPSEPGWWARA
jgi:hypothetical protein